MNERDVLIDIGFKSEGIIDRSEFNENDIPAIGDQVEVYLEFIEDASGILFYQKRKRISCVAGRNSKMLLKMKQLFLLRVLALILKFRKKKDFLVFGLIQKKLFIKNYQAFFS